MSNLRERSTKENNERKKVCQSCGKFPVTQAAKLGINSNCFLGFLLQAYQLAGFVIIFIYRANFY